MSAGFDLKNELIVANFFKSQKWIAPKKNLQKQSNL